MKDKLYHYEAKVLSVYDGDTITVMIDMGMKHFNRVKVRLLGINTPEIRTKDPVEKAKGINAREYLKERIEGKTVIIRTVKKGSFGRWLGEVWCADENGDILSESINNQMIRSGHAVEYRK